MINLNEVGAFGSVDASGNLSVRFGVCLPGIHSTDGFEVVVRVINRDDRFDPRVSPQDSPLNWVSGHPLDLWTATVSIPSVAGTHFGQQGTYLYRYQLWWTPAGGSPPACHDLVYRSVRPRYRRRRTRGRYTEQ